MTKTTKLWISPAQELRHAINGWPEPVSPLHDTLMYTCNGVSAYSYSKATELYEQCLAKAKEESIPFENMKDLLDRLAAQHGAIKVMTLKPDSFIEYKGKVEVVWQVRYMPSDKWIDVPNDKKLSDYKGWYSRQVAHLKPVDKSQLDSAGDKIPDGHTQCPVCYGSGEKVPDVTCKKCEGSGYVPDSGAMSYTEGMTDSDMHEAIERPMQNPFKTFPACNWEEDYAHENGNYINTCIECKMPFKGHKRRVVCKVCAGPNWEELAKKQAPQDNKCAHAGCWLEGEMVGFARCMVKKAIPMQARIKELEDAQTGLKDRILEAYYKKCKSWPRQDDFNRMLSDVLDEFKIR